MLNNCMANIILSAQNFDIYDGDGLDPQARTGDVSAEQLVRAGAEGVILGHSEVGDSPEVVRMKLLMLAKSTSLPYITLLVGETWEEFSGNCVEAVGRIVAERAQMILTDVPQTLLRTMVVGYEPKWGSRGSGRDDQPPPSPELIRACCAALRNMLATMDAGAMPIIYGGRSTPDRTEQILSDSNVSGLILGSACSSLEKTLAIAKAMEKVKGNSPKILHANFKAFALADSYEAYIDALSSLSESFTVYLSPPYTETRLVREILDQRKEE